MPKTTHTQVIEDLVDFYKRWPELRTSVAEMEVGVELGHDQKAILDWMVFVVDRVGPADLGLE